ncbi:MAG: response regulator transcription factor [Sphingopyxis sp.]
MTMPYTHWPAETAVRTILVVDDMEANRAVLCRRLEKYGYAVTSVDSGAAALAAVANRPPDIVLLDYMMPHMNGVDVLREWRANPATVNLPVIMVTARAEGSATIEALEAGADDYVAKPIDFDVLRARIETQFAKVTDTKHLRHANAMLDERVTLRTMALADLEVELEDEIQRRRTLEQQVGGAAAATPPQPPATPDAVARGLADLDGKFAVLFAACAAGKMPNLAQMAEIQYLIAEMRAAT